MLTRLFSQLANFWQRQKPSQRIALMALIAVVAILVPVLIVWATTPSYAVAFANLSEKDAGQIVTQLQNDNIPYKLRGTSTILVPTDQVYSVRLSMAQAGLPEQSSVGFELFSGNTLGMTEFTQKLNYQRALAGELERTIASIDTVDAVRVHIVTPESALFSSDQAPTTASVTIGVKPGASLDPAAVRAISYLVANSVEGLDPENVAVVDTQGNLLASGAGASGDAGAASGVDSRRTAEMGVATDIQKKVKNLIDTALGPNKSVVQVSVSLDWAEKLVTTQKFDPTPIAVRSSVGLSESYATDGEVIAGVPGATTNLPGTTAGTTPETAGNLVYNRTELTTNYEVTSSETQETIHPGDINRVSLSVLVDGISDTAQLQTLQAAISAAAGIDQDRGDVISVQTLNFDRTFALAQAEDLATSQRNATIITIIQIVAVVLVIGLLLWYVLRLLRNLRMASIDVWSPVLQPVSVMAALPSGGPGSGGPGGLSIEQLMASSSEPVEPVVLPSPRKKKEAAAVQSPEEEQMQKVINRLADESPVRVAEIIQMWLNEDKIKE